MLIERVAQPICRVCFSVDNKICLNLIIAEYFLGTAALTIVPVLSSTSIRGHSVGHILPK